MTTQNSESETAPAVDLHRVDIPLTEIVECNIVGADAADRTLTVHVPGGVRGTMIGDGATITLKRYDQTLPTEGAAKDA